MSALICILFSSSVFPQVILSPPEIDVKNLSESEKIFVTHDGKPILPTEITKIVIGVYKTGKEVFDPASGETHISNYSYMFETRTGDDGSITFTPKKDLVEIGTYGLFVHTDYGTAKGFINANLSELYPARPRSRLAPPSLTYDIKLAEYSYGQEISIDLNPDGENT